MPNLSESIRRIDLDDPGYNALSALADGNQNVRETIFDAAGPYLPVIVIGEYRFGLLSSRDREKRLGWLSELIRHWSILEISQETTIHYAELRRQLKDAVTPIASNDAWIAALALEHGLPLLTNDPISTSFAASNVLGFDAPQKKLSRCDVTATIPAELNNASTRPASAPNSITTLQSGPEPACHK